MSDKISAMREGGKRLGSIKSLLRSFVVVGTQFEEIEAEAQRHIARLQCKPSFSTVSGYQWATCVMKNEAVCHGIPHGNSVADGDLITIDIGLIYQGYHLDTTMSFVVGRSTPFLDTFLAVGQQSLDKAIAATVAGNSVYDISFAMEKPLRRHGYAAVYQLTGHGVGEELHMDPAIPCIPQRQDKKKILQVGQTLAVENMYTAGDPELVVASDGWTYTTKDGSLSAMFEETVLVTQKEPEVLTKAI